MAKKKKNTVITQVYRCIGTDRLSLGELAQRLNEVNAEAIRQGKPEWKPVGSPVNSSYNMQILVVREGELNLEE